MPISFDERRATLAGVCGAETAEPLLSWLIDRPDAEADLAACRHLHAAVLQVLIAAGARVVGTPQDAFVREHLLPLLAGGARGTNAGAPVQKDFDVLNEG